MKKINYVFLVFSFIFYLLIIFFPQYSGNLLVFSFWSSLIYLYLLWNKYPNYLFLVYLLFCFMYLFSYQLGEVTFLLLIMIVFYTILTKIFDLYKVSKNYFLIKTPIFEILALVALFIGAIFNISFYYVSLVFFIFIMNSSIIYPLLLHICLYKLNSKNIIINNKNSFINLYKIDSIIFNKTGVLTLGKLNISEVETGKEKMFWKYLSYAEETRNDRISTLIKESDNYQKVDLKKRSNYKEYFNGISYKYLTKNILVGNKDFLFERGIRIFDEEKSGTYIYVVCNDNILGYIIISDKLDLNTKKVISNFKSLGIKNFSVFSKDQEKLTTLVSRTLGIKSSYGNLTTKKSDFWLYYLKKINGDKIAFIGNDDVDYDVKAKIKLVSSNRNNNKDDIIILERSLDKCILLFRISKLLHSYRVFIGITYVFGLILLLLFSLLFFNRIWMLQLCSLVWILGIIVYFIIMVKKLMED